MYVAEVHFNHDRASANHDALNIRRNAEGDAILAPEWHWGYTPSHIGQAHIVLDAQCLKRLRRHRAKLHIEYALVLGEFHHAPTKLSHELVRIP